MESFIGKLREKTWLKRLDLPTEAQWEYACRAGTKTLFSVASPNLIGDDVGWFKNNSRCKVHPVGEKLPNAWGLYDMHGNVWEWCLDLSGGTLEGRDPVGPSADNNGWRYILGRRVLRGGCYYDSASKATSSYRGEDENTSDGSHYVGLRLFMIANE
jgi:formylglycine-generating enzyme required for sulfatase activity